MATSIHRRVSLVDQCLHTILFLIGWFLFVISDTSATGFRHFFRLQPLTYIWYAAAVSFNNGQLTSIVDKNTFNNLHIMLDMICEDC